MARTSKSAASKRSTGAQKSVQVDDRHILPNLLIQRTEEETQKKFSDYYLDRENEKHQLLSGAEVSISDLKEIQKLVAKTVQPYAAKFTQEFYREIFRLKGWIIEQASIYRKPRIVAVYTNDLIYRRFAKEVLPRLQQLNLFTEFGIRLHKHFQWLTEEGQQKVEEFIADSIRVMQSCSTWYEFRVKYAKQYGLSFQLNAFEDNQRII